MEIIGNRPGGPGGNVRAFLDVRLDNGVLVRGLRLVRTRNGMRVYGPTIGDRTIVALPPAVADEIAEAVAHGRT